MKKKVVGARVYESDRIWGNLQAAKRRAKREDCDFADIIHELILFAKESGAK